MRHLQKLKPNAMEKGDNVRRGSNVSAGAAVREDEEEEEEDPLDPRIQVELEKLNSLTDVINKLELDLEVSWPDPLDKTLVCPD